MKKHTFFRGLKSKFDLIFLKLHFGYLVINAVASQFAVQGVLGLNLTHKVRTVIYHPASLLSLKSPSLDNLLMVLLVLVKGGLPSRNVFNSDGPLSVQRAGPGGLQLTAAVPRGQLLVHYLFWKAIGAVLRMLPLSRGGGESDIRR